MSFNVSSLLCSLSGLIIGVIVSVILYVFFIVAVTARPIENTNAVVKNESPAPGVNNISREEKVRSIQSKRNKKFSFYGKIIDQDGQPVSGVNVHCHFNYFDGIIREDFKWNTKNITLTSDTQGMISVPSEMGIGFLIESMEKDGYQFEKNGFFGFNVETINSGSTPEYFSPNSPKIFHAFKTSQPAALISSEYSIGLEPDGTVYGVDFINKRLLKENTNEGDLQVSIKRIVPADWQHPYDWSVEISGTVLETDDPFMYKAPTSGYESSWKSQVQKDAKDYKRELNKRFFFKTKNGKYFGRVEMEVHSLHQGKAAVFLKYSINPFGDTNLQSDPEHQISLERVQEIGLEKAIEEVKASQSSQNH